MLSVFVTFSCFPFFVSRLIQFVSFFIAICEIDFQFLRQNCFKVNPTFFQCILYVFKNALCFKMTFNNTFLQINIKEGPFKVTLTLA